MTSHTPVEKHFQHSLDDEPILIFLKASGSFTQAPP
jgi:hypothetical protein